jgi:hypothetical protein
MLPYPIWRALYLAFYSRALYRDVAGRWRGAAFAYLAVLVVLWWIPGAVLLYQQTGEFMTNEAPQIVEQWPTVTVTRGHARADVTMPFAIVEPVTRTRLVVIDTTGSTSTLEAAQAPALLTATALILREGESGARSYPLADVEELVIDRALLQQWMDIVAAWVVPVATLFVMMFFYVYRLVQALVCAALGLLLVRATRANLDFAALVRLAIVALTPAVLLDALLWFAGSGVSGPISFAVTMGYLYFAIRANASPDAVVAA